MNLSHLPRKLFAAIGRDRGHLASADWWPTTIQAAPRHISTGDGYSATFALTGYPAEVSAAWLETLSWGAERVTVAVHVTGVDTAIAATRLASRRARLESARRYAGNRDRIDDPAVEAAAADAADLAGRVARGETRLHRLAVYTTVHARTEPELDAACAHLRSAAASALLDIRPVTWRQLDGLIATLPMGIDPVGTARTVDTEVVGATFPFTSVDPPENSGVLYGLNQSSGAPVTWDRWGCDNHNSVVVGRSGAGKSFFTKTELLRQLYGGVQVAVIDPDGEYTRLAEHVGGTITCLATEVGRVNPLDIGTDPASDALIRRVLFIQTLASTMLDGDLTSDETAALDSAVLAAYRGAGITTDPGTWQRTPPAPAVIEQQLRYEGTTVGSQLAAKLSPYLTGGFSQLFTSDEHTSKDESPLRVFNLSTVPDELSSVATLLVLDDIWRSLSSDANRRTLVVVDEAWLLLRTKAGADFLSRLAKSARKRLAGLMVVTQDAEDMLSSDLGRIVISNSATQILLRQAPQAIDLVTEAFHLTAAEHQLLLTARQGEALLLSGDTHVAFHAAAGPAEFSLCTTGLERAGDSEGQQ